ncbi:MAG: DNA primase [bacterium]|nr:DNA primase [bacterium]
MSLPTEEIKARLDIAEFIQSYMKLQKAGANYRANCPFHGEKTPSFYVSPVRQIWHCFGCGRGGDVFKFAMEIEGLDFTEALRMLAQRTGVVLKREDPAMRSEKNRLYETCDYAARIFQKNLDLNPAVRDYLKKRGVADKTIKDFQIGFAPASWDFLLKNLLAKGFKKEEIEKAGLSIKSEDRSSWYDRFRSRIIFPINDANGLVIGFGGRIFSDKQQGTSDKEEGRTEAKYINSPQTPIYDKSSVLYGFDKAKQEIRSKNQVVLVEGYMDCLMSHQAGLKNTVAVSGTALTGVQAKNLRRLCDSMIASFDADMAGESATRRSLGVGAQLEFDRKIAAVPSGKDPADTVAKSPELWLAAVAEAKPAVEYFFEKTFREKNPNNINGKKEISALLLPWIAELSNEVEKAHWISEMSRRLEIKEDSIWKELRRSSLGIKPLAVLASSNQSPKVLPKRRDLLEERLLSTMVMLDKEIFSKELKDDHLIFTSVLNSQLFEFLHGSNKIILSPEMQETIDQLKFKGELLKDFTGDLYDEFITCKKELEKVCIKEELGCLGQKIREKEKAGDAGEVAIKLTDFNNLSRKLKELEKPPK